ncbi:MAG: hypothetical protein IJ138_07325, partial [Clostridia bacterium]|nr:hypothetical protein [Clostridia bacterium]
MSCKSIVSFCVHCIFHHLIPSMARPAALYTALQNKTPFGRKSRDRRRDDYFQSIPPRLSTQKAASRAGSGKGIGTFTAVL